MANPYKGKKEIMLGGKMHVLKYDLNALVEVQDKLDLNGLNEVLETLQNMDFKIMRIILWAGLLHEYLDDDGNWIGGKELTMMQVGKWIGEDLTVLDVTGVMTDAISRAVGSDKEKNVGKTKVVTTK